MALVALKEPRYSQFFHCWVLLINSKDQNATFNGVLMAVCVLNTTCQCSSALELEQSWLYPHTTCGTAARCSRLCEECLHPGLEKDTTHSLSRKLPGTWAPTNPQLGGENHWAGNCSPPRGCVRAQQEWPVTGNESVTPRSGSGGRCHGAAWGRQGKWVQLPFIIKWTRYFCNSLTDSWEKGDEREGRWTSLQVWNRAQDVSCVMQFKFHISASCRET